MAGGMQRAAHAIAFIARHVLDRGTQSMQRSSRLPDVRICTVIQIRLKLNATCQLPLRVGTGAVHLELTSDNSDHELTT
jgi:hypothetical protein